MTVVDTNFYKFRTVIGHNIMKFSFMKGPMLAGPQAHFPSLPCNVLSAQSVSRWPAACRHPCGRHGQRPAIRHLWRRPQRHQPNVECPDLIDSVQSELAGPQTHLPSMAYRGLPTHSWPIGPRHSCTYARHRPWPATSASLVTAAASSAER